MRKYEVYFTGTGKIDWEYIGFGFSKVQALKRAKKEWMKKHKTPFPNEDNIYINVSPEFDA